MLPYTITVYNSIPQTINRYKYHKIIEFLPTVSDNQNGHLVNAIVYFQPPVYLLKVIPAGPIGII